RKLKPARECFRTLEVTAREHGKFLTVTIDRRSQPVSTCDRHLAIAKHSDFETTQYRRGREQFVELTDARIQYFKTARRIDGRKRMGHFQLLLEMVVISRTTIC